MGNGNRSEGFQKKEQLMDSNLQNLALQSRSQEPTHNEGPISQDYSGRERVVRMNKQ